MFLDYLDYIIIFQCKISTHLSDFGFIFCRKKQWLKCYIVCTVKYVQMQYKQHNLKGRFMALCMCSNNINVCDYEQEAKVILQKTASNLSSNGHSLLTVHGPLIIGTSESPSNTMCHRSTRISTPNRIIIHSLQLYNRQKDWHTTLKDHSC